MSILKGIVDLDYFVYSAGFAAQSTIRNVYAKGTRKYLATVPKGMRIKAFLQEKGLDANEINVESIVEVEPLANALQSAKQLLVTTQKVIQDSIECYLTGKENFRYDLYPNYKAARINSTRPVYYLEIREYYVNYWDAEIIEGYEADDKVAMRSYELFDNSIIVSIDKDLMTVPGYHFNPNKPEQGIFYHDWIEAKRFFYTQLLMGDDIDSIPGLKGVGIKTAEKLLKGIEDDREMYSVVQEAYLDKGLTVSEMHRNARLLHMLRSENDWWNPPK